MKAIAQTRYGSPDTLELREIDRPAVGDDDVLVRVEAASVNPYDLHYLRGLPYIVRAGGTRAGFGVRGPKLDVRGRDLAGVVEAVGPGVTRFKPGDEVFGAAPGAYAEYASARQDHLALKPANVSFEQAGAVGIAATTALQGLRDKGHLRAGQKVLVNGASGGVGTFAVQIAKAFGAEVTAVASARNLDQARSLGADHVIDYAKEDFTKTGQRYDLIYDIVGNRSTSAYKRALNPGGVCLLVGFGFPRLSWSTLLGHLLLDPIRSRVGDKKVRFVGIAKFKAEDLETLADLMGSGKVVPVIERRYPLEQTAEAMRYFGEGHARGKIVITVGPEGRTQGPPGGSA